MSPMCQGPGGVGHAQAWQTVLSIISVQVGFRCGQLLLKSFLIPVLPILTRGAALPILTQNLTSPAKGHIALLVCSWGGCLATLLLGPLAFGASCLLGGKFQVLGLLPRGLQAVYKGRAIVIVLWYVFWPPTFFF